MDGWMYGWRVELMALAIDIAIHGSSSSACGWPFAASRAACPRKETR